ncbi:hypothetical protein OF376_02570 [Ureaplasma miroungigenitalium]|uniref:Uncharacterized protein n=1 Tax=Ureaplasma miroungigenitalium TaxID=1042321 RepID=A0ABT3BNH7_9BACT|nr:hypothetical protein [Ureaplasma miroungigenitalium]MCV3728646.1 hypothetical protein [Ureaplasma miroungigenitalium]MCV3734337.1 hypothetical protein [Ureaplasma miroungigenitalium]
MIIINYIPEDQTISVSSDKIRENKKGNQLIINIENPGEGWQADKINNFLALLVDNEEELEVQLTPDATAAQKEVFAIDFVYELFHTFAKEYNLNRQMAK